MQEIRIKDVKLQKKELLNKIDLKFANYNVQKSI